LHNKLFTRSDHVNIIVNKTILNYLAILRRTNARAHLASTGRVGTMKRGSSGGGAIASITARILSACRRVRAARPRRVALRILLVVSGEGDRGRLTYRWIRLVVAVALMIGC
jgi:hypothetical protein